ncbi:MAG: carbon starvation CstA family protein [candidate division WOR-3 bacterium]
MNSIVVPVIGALVYIIGLRFYAFWVDRKVIGADGKRATPARMFADGVDFMPTSRNILFGYQFKSIAGAAPVLGPIIAIKWGWLPVFLWILLGTLFIGWVQDYTSAMVSVRNDGKTFGGISFTLISPRARTILLIFIYLYLLLIAAAFANTVATALAHAPRIPLAIVMLAVAGVVVGFLIYHGRVHLALVTVIGLILFYVALVINGHFSIVFGTPGTNRLVWLLFSLVFAFFGSILPIWIFVQPINYLSFYIILIGMIGAVLGIVIGRPVMQQPAFTSFTVGSLPLWPMLFVTVACGAISGWHGIVSSTGTSRQLENELDARPVAAGAMFLEMMLALIALVIVGVTTPGAQASWDQLFGSGLGNLFHFIGMPARWGEIYGPVMIVVLAITILHLVVRFMRIATNELLGKALPIVRLPVVGTTVAVFLAFVLAWTGTFNYIWVLFGSANQLMASLALLIGSVWLVSENKKAGFAIVPMIFMYLTTMAALVLTSKQLLYQAVSRTDLLGKPLTSAKIAGNWISGIIGLVLFGAAVVLAYDGVKALIGHARQSHGLEKG